MAPYDDWNKVEDEEDEELQDESYFEGKRDIILFCIDGSESMLRLRKDPNDPNAKTSHLFTALETAVQIQKRKVIVGPNDAVGILIFNTTRKSDKVIQSELKKGTFAYQPISALNAPTIQELMRALDAARDNPDELRTLLPPMQDKRVPMGDVFTSCNWVIRDGAPKTGTKRVFLITDEDDPHPGGGNRQLIISARTTLIDLIQAGVTVEPFFISTPEKPFDVTKFYSSVLPSTDFEDIEQQDSDLAESMSITRIEDLLSQMRFHEVPKRAHYSIPMTLAQGFTIGVKGYGLVTEQKKGSYKYFVDLGDRMEVATVRTVYIDEAREAEVDRDKILYGTSLGKSSAAEDGENGDEGEDESDARIVKSGKRPFYTAEEIRSFRTLGLEPGIKLLGFKDRDELALEDNVKHSQFVYPDEMAYSGSKRTFSALVKSMVKKQKIGLALTMTRRNTVPTFCALLPQEEKMDEEGWTDPIGLHLIPLPFADDIRAATVTKALRAPDQLKDAARAWIDKLSVKNGAYPPDSYPNPALAYHNAQLEASAFREQYDPDTFEDLTKPKDEVIHKRAGSLMKAWKNALAEDNSADIVDTGKTAGTKRKAEMSVDEAEIRSKYQTDSLSKMRVDQLKEFLRAKGQPVSGKKADLVERVATWLDAH